MNSFFFGNIRSFIGPFLIGLVSFAVLSTVFLNQLGFIFDIHEIRIAFIIFSFTYTIVPVLFLIAWLINNNRSLKQILALHEIITILGFTIMIMVGTGYLLMNPTLLHYELILIPSCIMAIILLVYATYLFTASKGSKSEKREFIISYGITILILVFFFYSNEKRLISIEEQLSSVNCDLKVYDRIKSIQSLALDTESTVRLVKLKFGIDDNDIGLAVHQLTDPQINNTNLKSLFKGADSAYQTMSGPIVNYDSIDLLKSSDIKQVADAITDIKKYKYGKLSVNDKYSLVIKLQELNARINNMAILYGDLHKKDWSNLINALKYKGLILFSLVLLFLLCLHYRVFTYNEECKSAHDNNYHSIEAKEKGYKLIERKPYFDLPELRILSSGISLIILLIIPALKPTKANNVDLDKPFISFGLAQFFHDENNSYNRHITRHSYTYNIDSVFYTDLQDNRIKIDIADLSREIKRNQELSITPGLDSLVRNIHDDTHSSAKNIIKYLNEFTIAGDRRFKKGTKEKLIKNIDEINH